MCHARESELPVDPERVDRTLENPHPRSRSPVVVASSFVTESIALAASRRGVARRDVNVNVDVDVNSLALTSRLESGIPSYDVTDDMPRPVAVRSWPSRRAEFHGDDACGRSETKETSVVYVSLSCSARTGSEALGTANTNGRSSPPSLALRNGSDDWGQFRTRFTHAGRQAGELDG